MSLFWLLYVSDNIRAIAQPDLTGDRAVALKAIKDVTIELNKAFATNTKCQKAAHQLQTYTIADSYRILKNIIQS